MTTFLRSRPTRPRRFARASPAASARPPQQLLPHLERGQRVDAAILRTAMEAAFGASDASGAWDWKTAYDACEAATVLFLRKYGKALLRKADSPAALLPLWPRSRAFSRPTPAAPPRARPSAILDADPARPRGHDRRRHRACGPSCWSLRPEPASSPSWPRSPAARSS